MAKEYLKDMATEVVKDIIKSNGELDRQVYERAYEDNMWRQGEVAKGVLGVDYLDYIEYHDHYQSFYYRLKNEGSKVARFLRNIDKDYLDEYDQKLYAKAIENLEKWSDMTWAEQDENEELEEQIYEQATELLDHIESNLHDYENVSDDDYNNTLEWYIEAYCEDMYILDGDKSVVYEDVVKSYK